MFIFLVLAIALVVGVLIWLVFLLGRESVDVWPKSAAVERSPHQAEEGPGLDMKEFKTDRANEPIRILFVGSAPENADRLALGREVREIERKLRETHEGRRFELLQEWAIRATELQTVLLRHKPHIVHFSGHGHASGELIFEDEQGTACPVAVDALERLFSILGDSISCVVLNACYSEAQAAAIRAHIPCVVGMRTAVFDDAAIAFSSSFYLALGHGYSVQKGFDLGRLQIDLSRMSDSDSPVLLTKPGIDPAKIAFAVEVSRQRS